MNKIYTLYVLVSLTSTLFGQSIYLDESFEDWSQGVTSYKDATGDGSASGVDIQDVRFSNDDLNIYIYFSTQKDINIQSNNDIAIFLDVDNNSSTGISKNGIGADLVYYFGDRSGQYFLGNNNYKIFHNDIGLVTSPTVTSNRFEVAISRKFFLGNININFGKTIKALLIDDAPAGDQAPNIGSYSITIDESIKAAIKPINLARNSINDIRFVSYNVLRDNLFEPNLSGSYRRILNSIKPDIIGFCEIYDKDAKATADLVESFLPSSNGQRWYADQANPDIRLVSRYPILERLSLDGNGVFVLNVRETKILYLVTHLPCCENESGRQAEIDKIMGFLRDVRYGISSLNVPQNTPIIISGDMNLVGFKEQQSTFKSGNIINNNLFGPDFNPDWDDSNLEDALPTTTGQPSTFTWYNEFGTFSAGRLDYFFYTGSVIKLKNSYALFTNGWTSAQLTSAGLQTRDILSASDHMPLVADFSLDLSSDVTNIETGLNFKLYLLEDQLIIENGLSIEIKSIRINNVLGQNVAFTPSINGEDIHISFGALSSSPQIFFLHCMLGEKKAVIKFVK